MVRYRFMIVEVTKVFREQNMKPHIYDEGYFLIQCRISLHFIEVFLSIYFTNIGMSIHIRIRIHIHAPSI